MDFYIGQIIIIAFNFAPDGFFLCDGSLLPVSYYPALFSLIGTYYGGDGVTNFALPDLRGRFPIGVNLGQAAGRPVVNYGQAGGGTQLTYNSVSTALTNGPTPVVTQIGEYVPPFAGVSFAICAEGIYPPRPA